MGYYINENAAGEPLPSTGKAAALVLDAGAKRVDGTRWEPNLICCVSNGPFDAAGFCYNRDEYLAFSEPRDTRKRIWLTHPDAVRLSGIPAKYLEQEVVART